MHEESNVIAFRPVAYPDSRDLIAPDGDSWCARTWIPDDKRHLLTHGKEYTPEELVRLYGLATSNGRPGLPIKPGKSLPERLRYVIEPLSAGQE